MTDEDKDRAMVEAIRARHAVGFVTADESRWELHKDRHILLKVVKDFQKQSQDYARLKLEYIREAARLEEAQKLIDRQAEELRLLRAVVNTCTVWQRGDAENAAARYALSEFDKKLASS